MSTNVYINEREACSKAARGKSAGAGPDPCWTPPQSAPVLVPYPNTAFAKDLVNGTCSVFIRGKMVAQADKSYFSTSTGNEGATQTLAKGLATSVIKGKAYFQSWSGDVFFEGHGVPRHEDFMTHNHGSNANVPPHRYIDSRAAKNECKKDIERMEKACKHDPNHKSAIEKLLGGEKFKKFEKVLDKVSEKTGAAPADWMKSHCQGMWLSPDTFSKDIAEELKALGAARDSFKTAIEQMSKDSFWDLAGTVGGKLAGAAGDIAVNKLENAAIRHTAALGGTLIGGVGGIVTEAAATVWTVGDAIYGVGQALWQVGFSVSEIKSILGEMNKIPDKVMGSLQEMVQNPKKGITNLMGTMGRLEPCLRAKKCILVPYKKDPKTGMTLNDMDGKGCCPGQTGHHVIPGASFENNPNCPGYDYYKAPTVCLEGGSGKEWGSHGAVHDKYSKKIKEYKEPGIFKFGDRSKISYEDAREYGIESIREEFPESLCNEKCLRHQLDEYHESVCDPKVLNASTGYRGNSRKDI